MFDESDIQQHVKDYLAGYESFEDLEDWLVEHSRVRFLENPPAIRETIGQVRYLIFQVIEGEITESQMKEEIRKLVSRSCEVSGLLFWHGKIFFEIALDSYR